jgi:broad specificity phosphatase PhoE
MATQQTSTVTAQLASKECDEHMEGMQEVYQSLRSRPMRIRAHALAADVTKVDASSNVKTVHFVRHGQGFHNLLADMATSLGTKWTQFSISPENPYVRPELLDAPLTEIGRQQAYQLQSTIAPFPVELVICSPMCRTIQTALMAFAPLVGTVPFMAHEMVREETGVHLCDHRRSVAQQQAEFPHIQFDLLESDEDPLFQHDQRETKMQVAHRIYTFMEWLSQRSEEHIAITSHSGWLLTLFNAVIDQECDSTLKTWWRTGEMRSVRLEFRSNSEADGSHRD